jgi:hypothetical protein
MATEAQLKEWRKYYRQSVLALPVVIGFAAVLCAVLWGLSCCLTIPIWLTSTLVGIAIFSVLADAINILYLRAKLRAVARK